MRLEILNLYLDGLLGLTEDPLKARLPLIEEALSAQSFLELLQEWVWVNNLNEKSCLVLKVWFSLSYRELGEIFGLTPREMNQLLRNLRVSALPPYRPAAQEDEAGISCFMVEQHLSPWLDGEIEDLRVMEAISAHTIRCLECASRLNQFRELQASILKQRFRQPPILQEEWVAAVGHLYIERRRQVLKFVFFLVLFLSVLAILAWFILSKPEKIPNIYEIN